MLDFLDEISGKEIILMTIPMVISPIAQSITAKASTLFTKQRARKAMQHFSSIVKIFIRYYSLIMASIFLGSLYVEIMQASDVDSYSQKEVGTLIHFAVFGLIFLGFFILEYSYNFIKVALKGEADQSTPAV